MFHEIWICLHWPFCPGVFIAILAFVAGAVAFRVEKASTVEKAIWTFVFLMLVVGEIWMMGIDRAKHDQEQADARSEQLRKFQEIADGIKDSNEKSQQHFDTTLALEKTNLSRTLGGLKETVNAATGGDGFCYVILVPPDYAGNANSFSTVVPRGKYPLANVNALVTDDDMMTQWLDEVNKRGKPNTGDEFAAIMQRAQEWVHIGDLPPQFSEQIAMRAGTVTGESRMLTIYFWANNGSWQEKLALRHINGKWVRLIRVWKQRLDKKKKALVLDKMFEQIDDGFPPDAEMKAVTK